MASSSEIKIKLCGITSVVDAKLVVDAGADYLGLIFVSASPRSVTISQADPIVQAVRGRILLVGVFQNNSAAQIQTVVSELGLDLVQVYSQESLEAYVSVKVPIIKAVTVSERVSPEQVSSLEASPQKLHAVLFDAPKQALPLPSAGVDPKTLQPFFALPEKPPWFLAGGLTPKTVCSRLDAIHSVYQTLPYGVDVASGIEKRPGLKDAAKLRNFCNKVQQYASRTPNR